MTNEQKKQLLLDLIKIEENGEIFNFTRAERAEFQKWGDGLIDQEPRWTPVSEGLPKVADCYEVTRKIGSDLMTGVCFFDRPNIWYNDNRRNLARNYLTNIIAWKPLSEPYVPQESEEE